MKRSFVSIFMPFFETDRTAGATAVPLPRLAFDEKGGRCVVVAANIPARRMGIQTGLGLTEARARCPDVAIYQISSADNQKALRKWAEACWQWTPWVAIEPTIPDKPEDGSAGLVLDITGCGHLFGGDALLPDRIRALFKGQNPPYTVRLALAETQAAAWALSRFGEETSSAPLRARLSTLPVAGLRLPPDIAMGLRRVGLRRIGDLYPMPRAALMRRFGPVVGQRLDALLGVDDKPFDPLPYPHRYEFLRSLAEPINGRDIILRVLGEGLQALCLQMETRKQGARRIMIEGTRPDHSYVRMIVATARACRDARLWLRLFQEKLADLDPGSGIETWRFSVLQAEDMTESQVAIHMTGDTHGQDRSAAQPLWALLARMTARLGEGSAKMPVIEPHHWPEHAGKWSMAGDQGSGRIARPVRIGGEERPPLVTRPLCLFAPPLPLGAVVEGQGLVRCFNWRGRQHEVLHAEGPEIIMPAWWQAEESQNPPRHYFRVQDREGERFWLFKTTTGKPAWFLHGIYP